VIAETDIENVAINEFSRSGSYEAQGVALIRGRIFHAES